MFSHLNSLLLIALEKKADDVIWQMIRSMKSVSISCIQKGLTEHLFLSYLRQLSSRKEVTDNRYVSREIVDSLCEIICAGIDTHLEIEWISLRLRFLRNFGISVIIRSEDIVADHIIANFVKPVRSTGFGYGSAQMVSKAIQVKNLEESNFSVATRERYFRDISENLIKTLRDLCRLS